MIKISYNGLPCTMLRMISNDSLPINPDDWNCPETVVTKFCNHPKSQGLFDINTAMKQIKEQGQYQCSCGRSAKSLSELAKDVKRLIITTFHKSTQEVNIKLGIILHKYRRTQRYQDALNNFIENNKQSFLDMQDRFHEQNSITNILIKQQYLEKQITLWAYCLLDRVKINIPVRIINCNHAECYELTSLLLKFDQMQNEQTKKFQCEFNGCNNHLMMDNLQTMASQLIVDLDYLKVLNGAPATQFKFQFDFQKKEFEKSPDFDPIIMECLQALKVPQQGIGTLSIAIQNHITIILSIDTLEYPEIKQLQNQQKFEVRNVNLIDKFTNRAIEYPVRCIKCPSTQCIDIRTLIADFEAKKKPQNYQCPLCGFKLEQNRLKNLKGQIYLDQSLLSKMFKDQLNLDRKTFNYNGKQYMKEEFIYKQKLTKDTCIEQFNKKHPEKGLVAEFENLFCIKNQNRRLQTPIIIINCPSKNIVDFETFYEEFQKSKFNIEADGIYLCRCDYCNLHPLKKYTSELFYHEALGYAIENSDMTTIQKGSKLVFNFNTNKQATMGREFLEGIKDQTKKGFIEILNDEEYKNVFKPKQLEGRIFQITNIQVEVINGLNADCNSQGMNLPVEEKIEHINQNANQDLKKWNFKCNAMSVELLTFQPVQSQKFDQSQMQK